MNTTVLFSSKNDDWETPQKLFDELNKEFRFTLDVAACTENAKCIDYYTKEIDGLSQKMGRRNMVQSAVWKKNRGMGKESLFICINKMYSCDATTCKNRHKMVS